MTLYKMILRTIILAMLCLFTLVMWGVSTPEITAQTPTSSPIVIIGVEPGVVVQGVGARLSIIGNNFTSDTTVRVWNIGFLPTTYINPSALTADLPAITPVGVYTVEVIDPVNGVASLNNALTVVAPPTTPLPPPTPIIIPTLPPEPGEPNLVVQNFSVSPSVVSAGGTATLRFDVINRGNRIAQGIIISVEAGNNISPAPGQANVLLPDLFPNGIATATLSILISSTTKGGTLNVPINMIYRDPYGANYTAKATLSVTVAEDTSSPQLMLARYMITPSQVRAGEAVTVEILITNTGTDVANQLMIKVKGGGALLPGAQGDTFAYGDLTAGATANIIMPLIVSTEAKAGVQAQTLTLSYVHRGETKTLETSFTMTVVASLPSEPSLLISAYDTGADVLKPGDRFTLNLTLLNVGDVAADELFVTFGNVEASTDGGSGSSTTPSTIFAPLETGGTVYVGRVQPDGTVDLSQNFIVNGTTNSGVYSLPVTLRYRSPNRTDPVQANLRISLIVISPPKLQITFDPPLPEMSEVGGMVSVTMAIKNIGAKAVEIPVIRVNVEGGEVNETDRFAPGIILKDATYNLTTSITPTQAGTMTISVVMDYIDDLNASRQMVYEYPIDIADVPPPPEDRDFDFVPDAFDACPDDGDNGFGVDFQGCPNPPTPLQPPTEEQPDRDDLLGRLILGLLGLGS